MSQIALFDFPEGWTASELQRKSLLLKGETIVLNIRKGHDTKLNEWAKEKGLFVRIDRWKDENNKESEFGNPFDLEREKDRDFVCESYRQYFLGRSDLMAKLPLLKGKALGCWCYPKRCHGNEIIKLIKENIV